MLIEYLNEHQATFWIITGIVLLAIEILAFGMASGVLLFAGSGALVTGTFLALGVIPPSWDVSIACFAVTSALSAITLWKPMKRMQGEGNVTPGQTSDLIGYSFRLDTDISTTKPGSCRYSGIAWRVEIADEATVVQISAGQIVRVVAVDVGLFHVVPEQPSHDLP